MVSAIHAMPCHAMRDTAVLYSDEAVGCLASAVQQLLVPGGVLVLADPAGAVAGLDEQARGRTLCHTAPSSSGTQTQPHHLFLRQAHLSCRNASICHTMYASIILVELVRCGRLQRG